VNQVLAGMDVPAGSHGDELVVEGPAVGLRVAFELR
jgi:hypothetical protein